MIRTNIFIYLLPVWKDELLQLLNEMSLQNFLGLIEHLLLAGSPLNIIAYINTTKINK